MSLIDTSEEQLIKTITDDIYKRYSEEELNSPYATTAPCNSYWHKRTEQQHRMDIVDYDFDTPLELQRLLDNVISKEYCSEYIVPVTVAAFKRRNRNYLEGEVSEYIYEF